MELAAIGGLTDDHQDGLPEGASYLICTETATNWPVAFITGLDPVADANLVAQQAFASLTVAVPEVGTAPGVDGLLLVGLRTWFWVANDEPVSATATIPGLSATVTATAASTTFRVDDGPATTCAGGGTPYDEGRPGSDQDQSCTHVFQVAGEHRVTVETTWTLAWTATNGVTGTLPDLVRTTELVLPLRSAEAATD